MTKTLIPVTGKLDVNQSANENSLILFLLNLLKCAVSPVLEVFFCKLKNAVQIKQIINLDKKTQSEAF